MKKIVGVFAAATMMFALPSVAMAAQFNSPSGTTVTDQSGVSISVSGDVTSASGNGYIDVNAGSAPAANVPAGVTPLATFEVVAEGDVQFSELSLTFSVGSQYAGAQATVYVVHSDGTQEAIPATVAADGTVGWHHHRRHHRHDRRHHDRHLRHLPLHRRLPGPGRRHDRCRLRGRWWRLRRPSQEGQRVA